MLLRLASGRLLEYGVYGAAHAAHTVIYHHGWPSTRHEAAFLHPHATKLGLRVLAINRPGVGRSTLNPAYSFESVVDDVRQLLDSTGEQRVVFMGTSGGGPYAAACAALLPERTSAVCLMASMTHTRDAPGLLQGMALSNRLGYLAINHAPGLSGAAMAGGTALLRLAGSVGLGPAAAATRRARAGGAGVDGAGGGGGASAAATSGSGPAGGSDGGGSDSDGSDGGGGLNAGGGSAMDADDGRSRATVAVVTTAPAADPAAAVTSESVGTVGRAAAGMGVSAAVTSLMLMAAGFSAADRSAVSRHMREQPELSALMAGSGAEAVAQGLGGLWQDMRLTSEPWGLPLERITAPTFIWQGDQDLNVTLAMARHLEAVIPGARGRLRVVAGAGHIGLGLDHGEEVLQELAAALRADGAGVTAGKTQ